MTEDGHDFEDGFVIEALFIHQPGWTEEDHEDFQSG
jgi:hypothetical protein